MCKKQLSVAFFQQDIAWENPAANFALVEQMLAQHIAQGHAPDMLVLPETFNVGFGNNMAALAEPPDGDSYRFARSVAQRHRLLFVATWPVREGEKVYNRLHWVFPDGSHGHYDKAHTFRMSSEATQLARGTRRATFEWRGWRIRPAVCYDLRFPLWLRNRNLGATTQELAPKAEMLQPQLDYPAACPRHREPKLSRGREPCGGRWHGYFLSRRLGRHRLQGAARRGGGTG